MTGGKCKGIRVTQNEGYGQYQERNGSMIEQILCRFKFPRYPLDETQVLYPLVVINANSFGNKNLIYKC